MRFYNNLVRRARILLCAILVTANLGSVPMKIYKNLIFNNLGKHSGPILFIYFLIFIINFFFYQILLGSVVGLVGYNFLINIFLILLK